MKAEGCVQRHQLAVLNSGSVRPELIEGLLENEECFDGLSTNGESKESCALGALRSSKGESQLRWRPLHGCSR